MKLLATAAIALALVTTQARAWEPAQCGVFCTTANTYPTSKGFFAVGFAVDPSNGKPYLSLQLYSNEIRNTVDLSFIKRLTVLIDRTALSFDKAQFGAAGPSVLFIPMTVDETRLFMNGRTITFIPDGANSISFDLTGSGAAAGDVIAAAGKVPPPSRTAKAPQRQAPSVARPPSDWRI